VLFHLVAVLARIATGIGNAFILILLTAKTGFAIRVNQILDSLLKATLSNQTSKPHNLAADPTCISCMHTD